MIAVIFLSTSVLGFLSPAYINPEVTFSDDQNQMDTTGGSNDSSNTGNGQSTGSSNTNTPGEIQPTPDQTNPGSIAYPSNPPDNGGKKCPVKTVEGPFGYPTYGPIYSGAESVGLSAFLASIFLMAL